ncbi:MAG TPA: low affinity iron permease family protein [Methylomirabilota bacterium]|nr:low affinity iron permease family protein [Methylomirabilota bacterium]
MNGQNNGEHGKPAVGEQFRKFAQSTAHFTGTPWVFLLACLAIAVWAVTGPLFHFSDTWQLVINTGTTIVTFLMVFLIQNTQNRDTRAIHLKLDELIRAMKGARNNLVNLEEMSDEELDKLHEEFQRVCENRKSNEQAETRLPRNQSKKHTTGAFKPAPAEHLPG